MLLSIAAWNAPGAEDGFSATFEAVFSRDQPADAAETELTLEVVIGDWTASLETDFEADTWDELGFEISWESGEAEVTSRLRFEPSKDRFKDWKTKVAWAFGETDLEIGFKLTRTRCWLSIDVDWANEWIEIDTRLRRRSASLGTPFRFYDAEAQAEFSICGVETSLEVQFDADEFDEATLEFSDIVIDPFPLLSLDVDVEWTIAGVTVEISPSFEADRVGCIEIELEAECSDGLIDSLRLAEVEVEGEFGSIEIDGTVLFDADDWIDDVYAATVEAAAEIGLAPGLDAEVELAVFWKGGEPSGFRPARIRTGLHVGLGAHLALELAIDLFVGPLTLRGLACKLEW